MSDAAGTVELTEDSLELSYSSSVATFDVDRAILDLAQLRRVREALGIWEGELTEWLADALGRNALDVEGVGHVEIKRGTARTQWDKVSLLRMVLDSHRPPTPDGEVDGTDTGVAFIGDEMVTCSPDLSRVLDVFNLPAPRVTALKERGIPVDELCEAIPGKLSVVIS